MERGDVISYTQFG